MVSSCWISGCLVLFSASEFRLIGVSNTIDSEGSHSLAYPITSVSLVVIAVVLQNSVLKGVGLTNCLTIGIFFLANCMVQVPQGPSNLFGGHSVVQTEIAAYIGRTKGTFFFKFLRAHSIFQRACPK